MEKREMFPYFHVIIVVGVFSVCSFALANGIYGIIYTKVKSLENMCVSNEITNQMAAMSDLHCGYICHAEAYSPSFSYDRTARICTCYRDFVLKNRSCGANEIVSTYYTAERTLEKPCAQPTDCKELNSTCTNGLCECNPGFKFIESEWKCRAGEPCAQPTDCKEPNTTCTTGMCECNPGFKFIDSERKCRAATIGKSCSSSVECHEQSSECREARCVCIQDHSYSLTEFACVPKPLVSGDYLISDPGVIPADHITASSSYGDKGCWEPWSARLQLEVFSFDCDRCCWASNILDKLQYIQVNLNEVHFVRSVTTQGLDTVDWAKLVTSYKVLSSIDGFSFNPVLDHTGTKDMIFPGNMRGYGNKAVTNELPCPIEAQYIRINPQEWIWWIVLRFDVIGCILYSSSLYYGYAVYDFADTYIEIASTISWCFLLTNYEGSLKILNIANCDFENGTCGWQHDERSLIKWQLGQTKNTIGGPHAVSCSYMYISSDQKKNVTAQITVTIRRAKALRCFSLWHTASMNFSGSLTVITSKCEHGIEKLGKVTTTNFSEQWSMTLVPVESGVYQIVIEGVWTDTSGGFLAIEDITLNENVCP